MFLVVKTKENIQSMRHKERFEEKDIALLLIEENNNNNNTNNKKCSHHRF